MSTKPLVFQGVSINGVNYTQHLVEDVSVEVTENTTMIDDGQTIVDSYDVAFNFKVYDTNVASDSNIYTNASATPVKSNVVFQGTTGAATLTVSATIVNAKHDFGGNRVAWNLFGTKRGVSLANTINVA